MHYLAYLWTNVLLMCSQHAYLNRLLTGINECFGFMHGRMGNLKCTFCHAHSSQSTWTCIVNQIFVDIQLIISQIWHDTKVFYSDRIQALLDGKRTTNSWVLWSVALVGFLWRLTRVHDPLCRRHKSLATLQVCPHIHDRTLFVNRAPVSEPVIPMMTPRYVHVSNILSVMQ